MKEIEDEGLPKQFGYASRLEVRLERAMYLMPSSNMDHV